MQGLSFITEGAIPLPPRSAPGDPAIVVGSATAGAISMGADSATSVPHGGVFDRSCRCGREALIWLLAVVAGTVVTAGVLFVTKRPIAAAPIDLTAVPATVGADTPSSALATV